MHHPIQLSQPDLEENRDFIVGLFEIHWNALMYTEIKCISLIPLVNTARNRIISRGMERFPEFLVECAAGPQDC